MQISQLTQKSNEWYTPIKYIEAAREVMGSIDLDPASCELANQTVKATRYYSQEDNGLVQPWYGRIWLNPPYSKPYPWIQKLCSADTIEQAILLVPNATDTAWFSSLWNYPICFQKGRILFYNPNQTKLSPWYPTVFVYLGSNEQRFIEVFSQFGRVAKAIDVPRKEVVSPVLWQEGSVGYNGWK